MNVWDIMSRFHVYNLTDDECYVGEKMAHKMLSDEFKESIDFDRPYFNAPSMASEAGNLIVFSNLVKDRLQKLGFKKEAFELTQISQLISNKYIKIDFLEMLYQFVDFKDFYKTVVVDGEEFHKVKKYSDEMKQKKEFNLFDSKNITEKHLEKNIYERNIFYYLKNEIQTIDLINYCKKQNNLQESLITIDVWGNTPLTFPHNLEVFSALLEEYYKLNKDFTARVLNSTNSFGISPMGSISAQLTDIVNQKGEINHIKLSQLSKIVCILNCIDSKQADNVIEGIKSIIKRQRQDNKTINDQINKVVTFLEKEMLNYTIKSSNEEISNKKIINKI